MNSIVAAQQYLGTHGIAINPVTSGVDGQVHPAVRFAVVNPNSTLLHQNPNLAPETRAAGVVVVDFG